MRQTILKIRYKKEIKKKQAIGMFNNKYNPT